MKRLLDPSFHYVPAARTNIMDRFRAAGFVPPSERRQVVRTAEERLRNLRADIDRLAVFSPDGETVTMDAYDLEAALAAADGFRKVGHGSH